MGINFVLSVAFGVFALMQSLSSEFADQYAPKEEQEQNKTSRKILFSILSFVSVIFFLNGYYLINNRFRQVKESSNPKQKEVIFGNYRNIFKVTPKKIYILTVRNFKQILPESALIGEL